MFGFIKFGSKQMGDESRWNGYTGGFRVLTGLVEVISAVLIIAGIWNDKLAAWGSLLIVVMMLGAIFTHIKIKDPAKEMMMPIILLILVLAVSLINIGYLLG